MKATAAERQAARERAWRAFTYAPTVEALDRAYEECKRLGMRNVVVGFHTDRRGRFVTDRVRLDVEHHVVRRGMAEGWA